mmetsp:Transcript_108/g.302  ORF Transcript_108/g.302 Transcript_108/m.302 type:complete len:200 (-) Transcript_108:163-762(-)
MFGHGSARSPHGNDPAQHPPICRLHLDDANLVGNIKRIVVGRQAHVRLLQAVGPDQRVDLRGLDLVHAADSLRDLPLVRARVNNEDEGVVVLDLLHGRLSGERVLQDGVLVELVDPGDGAARVLGVAEQTQGLRPVELGLEADLDGLLQVRALGERLGRLLRSLLSLTLPRRGRECGQRTPAGAWKNRSRHGAVRSRPP